MAFDWSQFYEKQGGRGVRPTFEAALDGWNAEPGLAIDLGCGDGVETRELAERGWQVLAIDSDPGVDDRVRAGLGAGRAAEGRPGLRGVRAPVLRSDALPLSVGGHP